MPSPILTSPKLFPWKSWVLGPKPSFGQAAKGWAGKQQEICLAGINVACGCQMIYWHVHVFTKHLVFRRFISLF